MKVYELFEMSPRLEKSNLMSLNSGEFKKFNSSQTLKEKYDLLPTAKGYIVGMSKDGNYAMIGQKGVRKEDGARGAFILGTIDFKKPMELSIDDEEIDFPQDKILQVDGVEIAKKYQRDGLGYLLYLSLINAGFMVISDNLQYLGGQAIWKKIAKFAINNAYKVYISDNAKLRMKNGNPEVYDGTNIDDAEIWSSYNDSKLYTLLVAKKNDI